jgi:SPP1 family predicted phage head-tail adaptor
MSVTIDAGLLRHSVVLANPGTPVQNSDGGFTDAWTALSPATVYAAIESATAARMERIANSTVTSNASHVVTLRYHPQVTTKTRVTFGTRTFQVVGVINEDEMNVLTRALCTELVP